MINRHEKLPPLEQIKEHGLDYNHKLIDLANQMYEIGGFLPSGGDHACV